ncbi:MAG: DUF4384 domain-containing protein [Chitinophagaceae bacterium]|nr:DUF4384 domain-containing protein [Chitinophagaceae bacterium]
MTDDPFDPNDNSGSGGGGRETSGGGGRGLGGLLSFLPLILGLFGRKTGGGGGRGGCGLILLIGLAIAAYFLLSKGGGGCNLASVGDIVRNFSPSGYDFNKDTFQKASIYEELSADDNKNPLPEAISLLRFAPARGDQGKQGSCVAWSSAYAAQTILFAAATHEDPNKIAFSPSYLYNQIKLDNCQGSYIQRAMETMQRNGGVALSAYPYNDQDCDREPGSADIRYGRNNQIHGFTRLTNDNEEINIRAIKEHLAKDVPVVIGMLVGDSFMQNMMGQELWEPSGMDASKMGMGGHAMCVIGYDDRKFGGAFQIMNSWTSDWGVNGIAWIRYGDFQEYVREAYGLDPLPRSANVANIPLECTVGLVNNETKSYIPLRFAGNNYFESASPISRGTRFKMEIKNETECYIYIFGQETDGSSYVLFPYLKQGETTSKHSPYCGITGYRLFPKSQSMEADSSGTKDQIAVIVSREPLEYNSINRLLSQSNKKNYVDKLNDVINDIRISSVRFEGTRDGNVHFKVNDNSNKAVGFVVAFDKN